MTRKTKTMGARHLSSNTRPTLGIKNKATSVLAAAVIVSIGSVAVSSPAMADEMTNVVSTLDQVDVATAAIPLAPVATAEVPVESVAPVVAPAEEPVAPPAPEPTIEPVEEVAAPVIEEVQAPIAQALPAEVPVSETLEVPETAAPTAPTTTPIPPIAEAPIVVLLTATVDESTVTASQRITGTLTGNELADNPVTVALSDGTQGAVTGNSFTIDVPVDLAPGPYVVIATRGTTTFEVPVTVAPIPPTINQSSSSVVQGEAFSIELLNFEQGAVGVTIGGESVPVTASGDQVTVQIPKDFEVGTHDFTVTRGNSTVSAQITVTARQLAALGVTTNSPVKAGDSIEGVVSGVDEFMGEVTVELVASNGMTVASQSYTPSGDSDINYNIDTNVLFPEGIYTVNVTQGDRVASAKVRITNDEENYDPKIEVTNSPINANESASVSGSGFRPLSAVNFTVTGPGGFSYDFNTLADLEGNVSGSIPTTWDALSGTYTVTAKDTVGAKVTATFEVVGLSPTITTQGSVSPGESFTVSGSGYKPNSKVTIDAGRLGSKSVTADKDGKFQETYTVDANAEPGAVSIVATGGKQSSSTSITVLDRVYNPQITVTAEPVPVGGRVYVSGSGFRPNSVATLITETNGTIFLNVDANGNIGAYFDVPLTETAGVKTLLVISGGNVLSGSYTVFVPVIVDPVDPTIPPVGPTDPGTPTEPVVPPVGPVEPGTPVAPDDGKGEEVVAPPVEKPAPPVDENQGLNNNLGSNDTVEQYVETTAPTEGLLDLYGTTVIPLSDATSVPKEPKKSTNPTAPATPTDISTTAPNTGDSTTSSAAPNLNIEANYASESAKTSSPIGWILGAIGLLGAGAAGAWFFLVGKKRREEAGIE